MKYLFLLLLTLPAAADFGYNSRTERFMSKDPELMIDEQEYHELATASFDLFGYYAERGYDSKHIFLEIIIFLEDKGTVTALQLARDLGRLWGYEE